MSMRQSDTVAYMSCKHCKSDQLLSIDSEQSYLIAIKPGSQLEKSKHVTVNPDTRVTDWLYSPDFMWHVQSASEVG
jgi:hypothetical protein